MLRVWFAELARVQPDAGLLALDLDRSGVGRPDADITTVLDVSAFRDLRDRAGAAHSSQRSPMADMPEQLVDAYLSTDLLVRVQPPWPGGEQERPALTAATHACSPFTLARPVDCYSSSLPPLSSPRRSGPSPSSRPAS